MTNWDEYYRDPAKYALAPYDYVVSFLRRYPGQAVYEAGFGSGANLAWAFQHGWEVGGCELSEAAWRWARTAIRALSITCRDQDYGHENCKECKTARQYDPVRHLVCEDVLLCSSKSERWDSVIDRSTLTYLDWPGAREAIKNVHRILKPGGHFLFTPYAEGHNDPTEPRLWHKYDVEEALSDFEILEHRLVIEENMLPGYGDGKAQWRVIARKP